jgi:hypothetical protein
MPTLDVTCPLALTAPSPSANAGGADDGTTDADEGAQPVRRVHLSAPGPLPTAASDCACDVDPGCSPSSRAECAPTTQDLALGSRTVLSTGPSPRTRRSMAIIEADSHLYPLASPRLGFPTLNLAAPMAEYTYDSSYTTGSSSSLHSSPQCLPRCLDLLECRHDTLQQHLRPHQPWFWFPLTQSPLRAPLRAL